MPGKNLRFMISGTCAGSVHGAAQRQLPVHCPGHADAFAPSHCSPASIVPLPQSEGVDVGVGVGTPPPLVGVACGSALQLVGYVPTFGAPSASVHSALKAVTQLTHETNDCKSVIGA